MIDPREHESLSALLTASQRMSIPGCPLHWLEIRWMAGGWVWRALAAAGRTRGAGTRVREEWRTLSAAFGRGARVTLDEVCAVELVDEGPPRPFVVDALTRVPLSPDELHRLVEARPDGIWPLEGNGSAPEALADGQTFLAPDGAGGSRVLRAHVPDLVAHTTETRVDLARVGVRLWVEPDLLRATLSQGNASVDVQGACVRVLAVYAQARRDDVPSGGWLRPMDAHAAWIALGGAPESPIRRVEWERSRLRGRLARQGVASVDRLFEVRREGETMRTRLGEFDVALS